MTNEITRETAQRVLWPDQCLADRKAYNAIQPEGAARYAEPDPLAPCPLCGAGPCKRERTPFA